MESPGDYLKREREQRGVSLLKIFETTRVPMKYLEAIETDRLEAMPHPTFVKGYIRSYCKVLGLDENDAVLRFDVWLSEKESENQEAGKPKPIQELKRAKAQASPPKPKREIKVPAGLGKVAVVAAGVVLVILAYSLTKRDLSVPEPQVTAPAPSLEVAATPAPSTEAAPQAAAVPVAQPPQAVAPVNTQPPVPVAQPVKAAPAPIVPAAVVKPVQPPLVKPVQQTAPAPQATTPKTEPVKNVAPVDGALIEQPKNHVLTANAREMVWLKVGIDKSEPVEVLLKQGERVTWSAADNISVIIGNAGGVSLTYNGKSISVLGAPGEVVGLRLPSGTSYKIKKTQQTQPAATEPLPPSAEPQMAPAINMPEVPAAQPSIAPEG